MTAETPTDNSATGLAGGWSGRSFRAVLIGFGLALTLGIAGVSLQDYRSDRAATLEQAEESALRFARIGFDQTVLTLSVIDEGLRDLALVDRLSIGTPAVAAQVRRHFLRRADRLDGLFTMLVYGADGDLAGNYDPAATPPPHLVDMPEFEALLALPPTAALDDRPLVIGRPVRLGGPERRLVLPLARPFPFGGEDAPETRLAVALLDLDQYHRRFAALEIGYRARFGLVRADGIILARTPDDGELIGRDVSQDDLVVEHLPRSPVGVYRVATALDGTPRILGYASAPGAPVLALTTIAQEDVLADSAQRATDYALASALAVGAVWTMILLLLRMQGRERRARHALAASTRKFRSYVDKSGDGIFVSDAQGRFREVNPASAAMSGFTPEEALGRPVRDFLFDDPANLEANRRLTRLALETGRANGRLDLRRPDGSALPIEVTLTPLEDGSLLGHARDISERLATEAALARRDAILLAISAAAERLLGGEPEADPDFRVVLEQLGRAAGADRVTLFDGAPVGDDLELAISQEWLAPGAPPDTERYSSPVRLGEHGLIDLLARYRRGEPYVATDAETDGRHLEMMQRRQIRSVAGFPIRVDGVFAGVLGLHLCRERRQWHPAELGALTVAARLIGAARQRRRDEAARQAGAAQLQRLTASVPGMVFEAVSDSTSTAEDSWRFSFVGAPSADILGLPPEALLAETFCFLPRIHPDDSEALQQSIHRALTGRQTWSAEFRTLDGADRMRWRRGLAIYREAEDGRLLWSGIIVDISPLKEAEETLRAAKEAAEEANRAKSEFLATVSHELRTPMNAVLGFAALLRNSALDDEQSAQLGFIESSGRGLMALIDDILDLAKLEAGHVELARDAVDLPELMASVRRLVSVLAAEKGLDLRLRVDPVAPLAVRGDLTRLRQILTNLATNAVKFTDRGWVEIALEPAPAPATVRLSVVDTGIGIAAEDVPRLFERFSQLAPVRTRSQGGIGLGLSICKRLVEAMGGSIGVDSTPGGGSRFWVDLPLPPVGERAAESTEAAARSLPLAPGDGAGRRILIAEDDSASQALAREVVRAIGHTPQVVADGAAAVATVAAGGIDLVLMDLDMPGMDGLDAARAIRALPAPAGRVPIVALTAKAMPGDAEASMAAGMDGHLPKPIDIEALVLLIDRFTAAPTSSGP